MLHSVWTRRGITGNEAKDERIQGAFPVCCGKDPRGETPSPPVIPQTLRTEAHQKPGASMPQCQASGGQRERFGCGGERFGYGGERFRCGGERFRCRRAPARPGAGKLCAAPGSAARGSGCCLRPRGRALVRSASVSCLTRSAAALPRSPPDASQRWCSYFQSVTLHA